MGPTDPRDAPMPVVRSQPHPDARASRAAAANSPPLWDTVETDLGRVGRVHQIVYNFITLIVSLGLNGIVNQQTSLGGHHLASIRVFMDYFALLIRHIVP